MPQRHPLTTTNAVPPGTARAFTVAGRKLALFNVDGQFHVIDDLCSHAGAPLSEGTLEGTKVICPWHEAAFDVTNGRALCRPATQGVASLPVFVNGDTIEVEL